jgi:hypothetical protein
LNIHPHEIEALLKATMGSQVELLDYQVAKRGRDYWVMLARLRHPAMEIVIKLAGPEAEMACQFDRTVTIQRLVASSTTIPMPEVIAVDISGQEWPWRYLIYAALPRTSGSCAAG